MAVYVDNQRLPFRGMLMSHMVADTEAELHAMAGHLGLRRTWFQNKPRGTPHYDVSVNMRERALQAGAIPVDREGLVGVIRRLREARRSA